MKKYSISNLYIIYLIISFIIIVLAFFELGTYFGLKKDIDMRSYKHILKNTLKNKYSSDNHEIKDKYSFMESYSIFSENGIYLPIIDSSKQEILDNKQKIAMNWFFTNNSLYLAIKSFPFGENFIKADKIVFKDKNNNIKVYYKNKVSREYCNIIQKDIDEINELVEKIKSNDSGDSIIVQTSKSDSSLYFTLTEYKLKLKLK